MVHLRQGMGQRELFEALFGAVRFDQGSVSWPGLASMYLAFCSGQTRSFDGVRATSAMPR
jgi:hypothetical protein